MVLVLDSSDSGKAVDAVTWFHEIGFRAYNAHDLDTLRSLFGSDFVGVDHRPVSLGTFDADGFVAFTAGLFELVRTQRLDHRWIETRGDVGLFHATETAETLDGAEVSFETIFVAVVADGKARRWDIFALEAEADARALFEELAASAANERRP